MKFGLNDSDFMVFEDIVVKPLKQNGWQIYIFGSRATGAQHPFSDIDVLLKRPALNENPRLLSQVKEAIEESRFPIKVDIVLFDEIAESYRERILQEKIEI